MSEYEPFGDEWKAEVMRLKKSEIVDMLAEALREKAATKHSVQRTTDKNGKTFNPYDLNDVARVDEFIKRRRERKPLGAK